MHDDAVGLNGSSASVQLSVDELRALGARPVEFFESSTAVVPSAEAGWRSMISRGIAIPIGSDAYQLSPAAQELLDFLVDAPALFLLSDHSNVGTGAAAYFADVGAALRVTQPVEGVWRFETIEFAGAAQLLLVMLSRHPLDRPERGLSSETTAALWRSTADPMSLLGGLPAPLPPEGWTLTSVSVSLRSGSVRTWSVVAVASQDDRTWIVSSSSESTPWCLESMLATLDLDELQ